MLFLITKWPVETAINSNAIIKIKKEGPSKTCELVADLPYTLLLVFHLQNNRSNTPYKGMIKELIEALNGMTEF